jgi:predicted nucleic acid-binding protein
MMPTTIDLPWTVDTNILVYAAETIANVPKKRIALKLLEKLYKDPGACLVGQVISEFMNVALRKKMLSRSEALQSVGILQSNARVLGASAQAYEQAWTLAGDHQYQVWDALIIAVCAEHNIKTLYSEDTGSLKRPLGVHVINPFAELVAA